MAKLSELRAKAKELGISAKTIRSAETASELEAIISDHSNGSGTKSKAKKAVKKAVTATKSATKKKGAAKKATAKKGSASSKRTPAKSTSGRQAKRSASASDDVKRNVLGKLNFSKTDGWNPREGSVPDVIVNALRKAKGNREAAFKALSSKLDKIVPTKTRNGRKRNIEERRNYLRYLISRNAWAFAIATGQHEAAEGRAEYGTAGTGQGNFKRAGSKAKAKAKSSTKKATAKSTKKATMKAKKGSARTAAKKSGTAKAKAAGRQAAKRKAAKK